MEKNVKQNAKARESALQNSAQRPRARQFTNTASTPVEQVLFLQRTAGNQAVQRLFNSGTVQAKPKVGQPGDMYEQEADRLAEKVMRMPEPKVQQEKKGEAKEPEELIQTGALTELVTPFARRHAETEQESIQPKQLPGPSSGATSALESHLHLLKNGGQPLSETERAFFEPRFGYDFSQVRVHTDKQAAETARNLNAQAYTAGRDVVFGAGKYAPETTEGKRLLAHELAHVVQQNSTDKILANSTTLKNDMLKCTLSPLVNVESISARQSLNSPIIQRKDETKGPVEILFTLDPFEEVKKIVQEVEAIEIAPEPESEIAKRVYEFLANLLPVVGNWIDAIFTGLDLYRLHEKPTLDPSTHHRYILQIPEAINKHYLLFLMNLQNAKNANKKGNQAMEPAFLMVSFYHFNQAAELLSWSKGLSEGRFTKEITFKPIEEKVGSWLEIKEQVYKSELLTGYVYSK
jgi:hypothetical protein